ncbi:MAG: L-serine ammonia-lyase, iron-sulfur-dependent, subunit alpha [Candidatus Kapaibacterium sp.]|jgi:L-serine dehydratase|nr:L-serine ammonia-lyase, iron-sulfur-dependent, subunit alpha [Candidatus Kapabacteria bacterium]
MESIKKLFKIDNGPSSSHTIGPKNAAMKFLQDNPNSNHIRCTLYGSLAATGRGHLTDVAISNVFKDMEHEILWKPEEYLPHHPNGMKFESLDENKNILSEWTVYSVGGGNLEDGTMHETEEHIYPNVKLSEILIWAERNGRTFWEYVIEHEGISIINYLEDVWSAMQNSIKNGLKNEGQLPGGLGLSRKASSFAEKAKKYSGSIKRRSLLFSYALAVGEENACGGQIVTAPTCGSSGVLPAVLYMLKKNLKHTDTRIVKALATAGLIGNIVKYNASISGAKVGCQGEIGTACSMAAGAAAQIFGANPLEVEYAAEMGLEHHLGLTCDPIGGLVQIPCIERNAFAAARALDAATYSILAGGQHLVSFDKIVRVMRSTGHDLPSIYKETSEGGMAKYVKLQMLK